jgi:hypothetical protein
MIDTVTAGVAEKVVISSWRSLSSSSNFNHDSCVNNFCSDSRLEASSSQELRWRI